MHLTFIFFPSRSFANTSIMSASVGLGRCEQAHQEYIYVLYILLYAGRYWQSFDCKISSTSKIIWIRKRGNDIKVISIARFPFSLRNLKKKSFSLFNNRVSKFMNYGYHIDFFIDILIIYLRLVPNLNIVP